MFTCVWGANVYLCLGSQTSLGKHSRASSCSGGPLRHGQVCMSTAERLAAVSSCHLIVLGLQAQPEDGTSPCSKPWFCLHGVHGGKVGQTAMLQGPSSATKWPLRAAGISVHSPAQPDARGSRQPPAIQAEGNVPQESAVSQLHSRRVLNAQYLCRGTSGRQTLCRLRQGATLNRISVPAGVDMRRADPPLPLSRRDLEQHLSACRG